MIKTLTPLFARGKKNQILEWQVEVEDDKYRTVTGAKGCKKVTSEWTVVSDGKNLGKKNCTTPNEQAMLEATAKWEKKQKSGGYWLNINDIDKTKFVEPILAYNYNDYSKKIDFSKERWGVQNKYNGICCIATVNGCFSRKGEKFVSFPHVENSLNPFFIKYPNAVLHGEIFNDDYRQQLNEIVKLCRKTKHITQNDLDNSEKLIRFFIYDGYFIDVNLGEESPYENRKSWIDINVIDNYKYCKNVPTVVISSFEELTKIFQEKIDRGDEGVILRKMDMPYEHNRSKYLLKYKPELDSEASILSIHEGEGNWTGAAKTATLLWNNKEFDVTFKGTYKSLEVVLKNKKDWIGKTITFSYNDLTGLGTPQYGRIDINNCFKGDR